VTLLTSPPKLAFWVLESRLIVWLGRRSYSIYLWHFGINGYLLIQYNWPEVMIAIPGAILSFAIAAASFRWVETPFLRLKTRYSAPPATIPALEETQAQRAPGLSGS
jgi:peptidoglycan/LPS O-acetylase OafA/YrhL